MEKMIDPEKNPRFFDPEMAELASFHHRTKTYESHLKKIRIILVIGLSIIIFLLWQFSTNGRFRPITSDGQLIVDSRTGEVFTYEGISLKSQEMEGVNKKKEIFRMTIWPFLAW